MDPETNPVEYPQTTPADVEYPQTTPADVEYPQTTPADVAEVEKVTDAELNVTVDEPGTLSKLPPAEKSTDQQWQQLKGQFYWLSSVLPERLNEVYRENKQTVRTAGIALAAVPLVVLTIAILEVIDAIPLMSPTFELIGFGFTSWFIYRYLLFVERRQELSREFQSLKDQILGKNDPSEP